VLLPPWWGKVGMGGTLGRSAPRMRTPTRPSPVEGEGNGVKVTRMRYLPLSVSTGEGSCL
jgi:hypothetical protein